MRYSVAFPRSLRLSRLAATGLLALGASACSGESMKFGGNPFSNPLSMQADPAATGSVSKRPPRPAGAPARQAGVTSSPLPAPTTPGVQARTVAPAAATVASITPATGVVGSANGWSPAGGTSVVVAQGESIRTLSDRYGVPLAALAGANGLQPNAQLDPGTRLTIPVYRPGVATATSPAPAKPVVAAKLLAPAQTPRVIAQAAPAASQPAFRLVQGPAAAKAQTQVSKVDVQRARTAVKLAAKDPAKRSAGEDEDEGKSPAKAVTSTPSAPRVQGRPMKAAARVAGAAPPKPVLVAVVKVEPKPVLKQVAKIETPKPAPKVAKVEAKPAPQAVAKVETPSPKLAKIEMPKAEKLAKVEPVRAAVEPQKLAKAEPQAAVKIEAQAPKAPETLKLAKAEPAPAPEPVTTGSIASASKDAGSKDLGGDFRWPAKGRIINGFRAGSNDGINIAVPEGTPVKAADEGVVAYAGGELKGYGNLVLVKHSNGFVSAYAHNGALAVKKGETVKRGQQIATSGQTGNVSSPQLHFELRKGSTPVDPTQHLAGL